MKRLNIIKVITIFLILFICSFVFINNINAKGDYKSDWKVKITSNSKKLINTEDIEFEVEKSAHVANGKFAPGLKATSKIEIDLTGTKVPVDIYMTIDDTNLNKVFNLTTKLDEKSYTSGKVQTIELENNKEFTKVNGKKVFTLELEWINDSTNNKIDTILGSNDKNITIPIKVYVKQHIK